MLVLVLGKQYLGREHGGTEQIRKRTNGHGQQCGGYGRKGVGRGVRGYMGGKW